MRILLLGFAKLKFMPYLRFYLDNLDAGKHDIHVLYWNRDLLPEDTSAFQAYTLHEFKCEQPDDVPKLSKIKSFRQYRRFALRVLREEAFDFIIVLHTLPGVILADRLCGKFRGRYVLDYRDYTYERFGPYKMMVACLINRSRVSFVSSDAFRVYLPKSDKLYTSHNLDTDALSKREARTHALAPVRIRYWGLIRYVDTHVRLIDHIRNDPRFELHFHGREQNDCQRIRNHCEQNDVRNVFFHGEYEPEERYSFARETDLIQNVQDFDRVTENAVSNKFYDGPLLYIPQICTKGSYMGDCAERYGIGLAMDMSAENVADMLYNYLKDLDWERFRHNCDAYVDKVTCEYNAGVDALRRAVAGGKDA